MKNMKNMKIEFSKLILSIAVLSIVHVGGNELMGANIDLGIQIVDGNILADSQGVDLGAGQVFIGSWKASVGTNYALTLDGLSSVSDLSAHFTIALSTTWDSAKTGVNADGLLLRNIADDTGLATKFVDAVFFSADATEFGAIRWNAAWPGTEDTARGTDIALVVPTLDVDAAPFVLVGSLRDNMDGTGQVRAIPEPSSTALLWGAAFLLILVRNINTRTVNSKS